MSLLRTPLHGAHTALGARMVAFAGYEMPLHYAGGVMAEHNWTRSSAGLFDVSHMGQARLIGVSPLSAFEDVVPGDVIGLKPGRQRYSLLLNAKGGIVDDLMLARPAGEAAEAGLFIVVNGACKAKDFRFIEDELAGQARLTPLADRALLAIQGPLAAAALAAHAPGAGDLAFMDSAVMAVAGVAAIVSRSGYTGEDGFEISVPAEAAPGLWDRLLSDERVRPVGLGARDSLRLEAGLPLYGQDLDEAVSPIEAGLDFAVSKRRREAGDFPGAARIRAELADGPARLRVGLKVEGAPARQGAEIVDSAGAVVGRVTSGGFSPTLSAPIALGFVPPALAAPGTELGVLVRGRRQGAVVCALPFVPHRYIRKP